MSVLWSTSDLAERFAPYVEELQEFFASCGLHYGSPSDVLPLTQRLEDRVDFAEDLASMVRSIILREGGSVPRSELLEIIAVSIGGPDIDQAAPELQQTVLHLLAFVNTVLRKPWNEPPDHLNTDYTPEEPGGGPEEPPPPPIKKPIEFPGPRAVSAYARPDSIYSKCDRSPRPLDPAPNFARADFAPTRVTTPPPIGLPDPPPTPHPYSDPDREPNDTPILVPDPTPDPTLEPAPARPQDFAAHELPQRANLAPPSTIDSDPPSPSASPPLRNAMIAGAGALLAAAMMIIFLRPTSPATAPNPTPNPTIASRTTPVLTTSPTVTTTAVEPVPETKPSPYGPAFATPSHPARSIRSDDYVAPPYHTPIPGQSEAPKQSASTIQPAANTIPAAAPIVRSHPADPDAVYVGEYAPKRATPATYREASGTLTHRPMTPESRFAASREPMPSVSSGMMAGNLISSPLPTYPKLAKLTHTEGQVILQAVIARDGTVSATHVLSGHHLLRGAAVDAVRQWRYRPYVMDGHPVDVATVVTVDFHPPR